MGRHAPAVGIALALLAVLGALPARAGRMSEKAKAYARRNNLPFQEVPIELSDGSKISRVFVPVTEETHADFAQEFTHEAAYLRQTATDFEHTFMALGPNHAIYADGSTVVPVASANAGGLYVALDMTDAEKAYFADHVAASQAAGNVLDRNSGCMAWLVNNAVAPGIPIAHRYGVRSSTAPTTLLRKLVHVGNEDVVVGVSVEAPHADQLATIRRQADGLEFLIGSDEQKLAKLQASPSAVIEAKVAARQQAIDKLEGVIEARQHKPIFRDAVAQWQGQIAGHRQQIFDLVNGRQLAFDQRLAETNAAIAQLQGKIDQARGGADLSPELLIGWRRMLGAREQLRAELVRGGPTAYTAHYADRLMQLLQEIGETEAKADELEAALQRDEWHPPTWLQQSRDFVQQQLEPTRAHAQGKAKLRDALIALGPENYNPEYERRVAALEATIAASEAQIATYGHLPQYANSHYTWNRILESQREERNAVVAHGPHHFVDNTEEVQKLQRQIAVHRASLDLLKGELSLAQAAEREPGLFDHFNQMTRAQLLGPPPAGEMAR